MPEYTVVFDVVQSGYRHWWFAAAGLIFVVLGALAMRFRHLLPDRVPAFFPYVIFFFATAWTLFAFAITGAGFFSLSSALREGRCEVVEGIVSDFHPMPYSGHENEWFVVDGHRFEYSDFEVSPGFNQTASHGGPIRKGIRLRVHYVDNDIARLEVAR